jgi:hypothetical protein
VSQFVTQTLDDTITVLVIAPDDDPLARGVVAVLQKNGLKVLRVSPSLTKLQAVNQDNIYKYILIDQSKEILSWFKPLQKKLLVIGQMVTPYQGRVSALVDWQTASQKQQQQWQRVWQELPEASYCLGQDLFDDQTWPVWASSLTQKAAEGQVYSLNKQVFPQPSDYFSTTISRVLLAPLRGEKQIFQGGGVGINKLAAKISRQFQLLTEHKLEEKKISLESDQDELDIFPQVSGQEWQISTSGRQFGDDLAQLVASQLPKAVQTQSSARVGESDQNLPKPKASTKAAAPPPTKSVAPLAPMAPEPVESSLADKQEEQLETALQKMFADKQVERKVERVTKVAQETKTVKTKHKRKRSLFYLGLGFIGVSLGILVLFGGFLVSIALLERQLLTVSQKLQQTHTKTFNEESQQLAFLTSVVEAQRDSYQVLFAESLFSYPNSLVDVSHNLIGLGESLNLTRNFVQQAVRQALGSETGDVFSTLQAASNKANQVYQQLSLLQAAIDGLDQTKLSPEEIQKLENFTATVQEERKSLAIVQQLQPLMPHLLGTEGKRTYALILQDNQELRPTGGFLNSVALVTVDQGLVIDNQVYSIYDLEKRFAGEIEPPEEIKTLLQEDKLYLHDANWDPDYHQTAEQLAWFLEKTTGNKVAGVFAFDLYAVEQIIKATGPLELPEYNEVLTDRNIHERAEFHSEITLTDEPGERSYLPVVLQKLLNQVLLTPQENVGALLAGLNQSIKQNHLLLYFTDQSENTSFSSLGWTGTILNPECPVQLAQASCVVDAFYQVEANIGVNKANHYINRSVNHVISLGSDQAMHTRTISLKNTAPTNAWPRGEYGTYIRFYLPKESALTGLSVDGLPVDQSLLKQEVINDRPVVGVVVRVPIQTEQELAIEFTTPLAETELFSYAFFDQKQPGLGETDWVVSISSEDGRVPTTIAPQASVAGQAVTFNQTQSNHQFVGVLYE